MKILHVVEPFSSGIITFISQLVNFMPDQQNYVLHGSRVSADNMENVKSLFDQKTTFMLWKNAGREINVASDFLAAIELFKTLRLLKPEIVHLHSSKAGFLGRVVCAFYKCKVIYTPNGLSFAREDIPKSSKWLFIFLERMASFFSGKVIACSQSEMNLLMSYGINSIFINNGTFIKDEKYSRVVTDKQPIVVGCMALITEQKDPITFNKIASSFLGNEEVKFLWIGDGHLKKELKCQNIEVTGWLNSDAKDEKFEQIDIYLSTSLWEGLPFSVLEAMNKKQCLVLRDCIGNVDLVEDETNGFLFDDYNRAIEQIEYLLANPWKLSRMGENSHKKLKIEFNVLDMALNYQKEYQSP